MKFLDCFVVPPRNDAKRQWEQSPIGAQDIKQAVKRSGTLATHAAAIDPSHRPSQRWDDMAAAKP